MVSLADCNRDITEFILVLNEEIKILRAGKYREIQNTSGRKAALFKALEITLKSVDFAAYPQEYRRHIAPQLARLKRLSVENGLLLSSASRGLKSVQEHIFALQNKRQQVGAYGRAGQELCFDEAPTSREKSI